MQGAEFISFSPRAARGEGARRAGEGCRPKQRLVASQDDTGASLLRLCLVRLAPVLACLMVCLLLAGRDGGQVLSILPATNAVSLAFTSNVPLLMLAQTNLPDLSFLESTTAGNASLRGGLDTGTPALSSTRSTDVPTASQAAPPLGGQVERNVWFNGSAMLARGWN
jgi:hypothetical protein